MPERDFLRWPFLDDAHRDFAARVEDWAGRHAEALTDHRDAEASTRALARAMGEAGLLDADVPPEGRLDVRKLCLARDILARRSGLADLAMEGLGTGAVTLFGSPELREAVPPGVRAGTSLAAFALSEPEAGSDVAALATTALRDGADCRISGEKTWISISAVAGSILPFARTGEAPGARGLTAFWLPGNAEGLSIAERIEVAAPHPLARLRLDGVRVPDAHRIGAPGEGFSATLFGQQMTQAAIADAAVSVEASALLVYRAAWLKDGGAPRVSREASMAKLRATEAAFPVADACQRIHGGLGVIRDSAPELLARVVRALRVYEGASEIQRVVIARAERDRRAG